VSTVYHSVNDRLKGITNTVEDVYHIVANGTVQTVNNIIDKRAWVIINVSHDTQTKIL
jgi:hypothetical protein